ncbi:hypothetical protein Tco_0217312 [Tanacetum coccineum]
MINEGVTAVLAARNTTRNGDDSHTSGTRVRRNERAVRECTYQDFMKCQPLFFRGTEGSGMKSEGIEAELWNLKSKRHDVVAYNQRFQELALLSDRMCPERDLTKIEGYVGGMLRPDLLKTLQEDLPQWQEQESGRGMVNGIGQGLCSGSCRAKPDKQYRSSCLRQAREVSSCKDVTYFCTFYVKETGDKSKEEATARFVIRVVITFSEVFPEGSTCIDLAPSEMSKNWADQCKSFSEKAFIRPSYVQWGVSSSIRQEEKMDRYECAGLSGTKQTKGEEPLSATEELMTYLGPTSRVECVYAKIGTRTSNEHEEQSEVNIGVVVERELLCQNCFKCEFLDSQVLLGYIDDSFKGFCKIVQTNDQAHSKEGEGHMCRSDALEQEYDENHHEPWKPEGTSRSEDVGRGKLNPRFVGPFKVIKGLEDVAYKLELPEELSRSRVKRLKRSRIPLVKVRWKLQEEVLSSTWNVKINSGIEISTLYHQGNCNVVKCRVISLEGQGQI